MGRFSGVDIERLRKTLKNIARHSTHLGDCTNDHLECAVLAVIERLEAVERERDGLLAAMEQMRGWVAGLHARSTTLLTDIKSRCDSRPADYSREGEHG